MTQTRTPSWPDRHWAEIQTQAIALPLGRAGRIPASHHSRVSETAELANTWCLVGAAAILRPILLARSMWRSRESRQPKGDMLEGWYWWPCAARSSTCRNSGRLDHRTVPKAQA